MPVTLTSVHLTAADRNWQSGLKYRAVTRTAPFLIVNAEIGVVGQKIKLVALCLRDCARESCGVLVRQGSA